PFIPQPVGHRQVRLGKIRIGFHSLASGSLRFTHCFFGLEWYVPDTHRITAGQSGISQSAVRIFFARTLIGLNRLVQSAWSPLAPEIPAAQKLLVCFDVIGVSPS